MCGSVALWLCGSVAVWLCVDVSLPLNVSLRNRLLVLGAEGGAAIAGVLPDLRSLTTLKYALVLEVTVVCGATWVRLH
jgi:hypothetical protein